MGTAGGWNLITCSKSVDVPENRSPTLLKGAEVRDDFLLSTRDERRLLRASRLSSFAQDVHAFDTNPIYAMLHESIYCNGAARVGSPSARFAASPASSTSRRRRPDDPSRLVLFTGEMVFLFMFDEIAALRLFGPAAEILAAKDDWPRLYDADALNANDVPTACATWRTLSWTSTSRRRRRRRSRREGMGHQRVHAQRRSRDIPDTETHAMARDEEPMTDDARRDATRRESVANAARASRGEAR